MWFSFRVILKSPWLNRKEKTSWMLCAPGILWVVMFLVAPLFLILRMSFLSRDELGEPGHPLTFENYARFFGFGLLGFEPLYPQILLRTLWLAGITSVTGLMAALPFSFFIASLPRRWKNVALTLVVIPLWTNLVVRTYAWQILLGPGGTLTSVARSFGLVGAGEGLYPGNLSVLIGMICDYLPFLTLPVYASVEKIDWVLVEAARDLGARGASLFRHAIFPQILPGLATGVLLTFIPALGQFLIPDLLGGGKTVLLGNVVEQQFGPSGDWPFGSAIAVITLTLVLAVLYFRISRSSTRRSS